MLRDKGKDVIIEDDLKMKCELAQKYLTLESDD
jgi:hypothetical protein